MAKRKSINYPGFKHENPIPNASRIGSILMSSIISGRDPASGAYFSIPNRPTIAVTGPAAINGTYFSSGVVIVAWTDQRSLGRTPGIAVQDPGLVVVGQRLAVNRFQEALAHFVVHLVECADDCVRNVRMLQRWGIRI